MSRRAGVSPAILGAAVLVVVLALGPYIFSDYFLSAILTKAIWLGIAALSLIFLAGYGGMISLGQTAIYGIAGLTYANAVEADGGLDAAVTPWLGAVIAIAITVGVAFVFGAVAARSEGIYFLMLTLAYAVIVFFFWGGVTDLSGFGGVNDVTAPGLVSVPTIDPDNLYYVALVCAIACFLFVRYLVRTPFGVGLQGIRDEPTRMRALGFNVALHRTLAFVLAAVIAAIAGILSVWWNSRIDPNSISVGRTLDLLVIAVVGGLFRLEGAFIGAIVFVVIDNYTRGTSLIGDRFNTVIGVVFLAIVLASPGGLVGIWEWLWGQVRRRAGRGPGGPGRESPEPAAAGPGG